MVSECSLNGVDVIFVAQEQMGSVQDDRDGRKSRMSCEPPEAPTTSSLRQKGGREKPSYRNPHPFLSESDNVPGYMTIPPLEKIAMEVGKPVNQDVSCFPLSPESLIPSMNARAPMGPILAAGCSLRLHE